MQRDVPVDPVVRYERDHREGTRELGKPALHPKEGLVVCRCWTREIDGLHARVRFDQRRDGILEGEPIAEHHRLTAEEHGLRREIPHRVGAAPAKAVRVDVGVEFLGGRRRGQSRRPLAPQHDVRDDHGKQRCHENASGRAEERPQRRRREPPREPRADNDEDDDPEHHRCAASDVQPAELLRGRDAVAHRHVPFEPEVVGDDGPRDERTADQPGDQLAGQPGAPWPILLETLGHALRE